MPQPIRPILAAVALFLLAACGGDRDLDEPFEPLGAFKLGHNIVVADMVQKVEPSRDVAPEEWEAALRKAIDRRFSRYTGDRFYHIAIAVQGYSVAVTGIPMVLAPKSVMVVSATVWDDAAGVKLNPEPEQFTIIEEFTPENAIIGSGATQTKEEQVAALSAQAARQIEGWMRRNAQWFEPGAVPEGAAAAGGAGAEARAAAAAATAAALQAPAAPAPGGP